MVIMVIHQELLLETKTRNITGIHALLVSPLTVNNLENQSMYW